MQRAAQQQVNPPSLLEATVPELLQVIDEKERIILEQRKLLALLEEQLRLARIRQYGARSEKNPHQVLLFDEAELEVALEEVEEQLPRPPRANRRASASPARASPRRWRGCA